MLETDCNVFVDDIIKSFMKEYKQIAGSGFSFKFVSSLNIKQDKVNEPKNSSYINLSNWLRYKYATITSKNLEDRCFQYVFSLTQCHKEIKNHPEQVSKNKPFLNLYNLKHIEYLIVINKNNYT